MRIIADVSVVFVVVDTRFAVFIVTKLLYPGQEPKCQVCGSRLVDAHYVNMAGSGKNQYFMKGEVLHLSKYNPGKLYGRAPVNTLWRQPRR